MLLVDESKSSAEIDALVTDDVPFKSLLIRGVAPRLGASWDLTWEDSALGDGTAQEDAPD